MSVEAREKIAERIERKYGGLIMKIAYDITRDYDSAEDVKQEVLFKCSKHHKTLEGLCEGQFHNYVVRAAKNTALNAATKREHEEIAVDKYMRERSLEFGFDQVDFKAFEENHEFSPEMVALLKSMDKIDREIILLKFYMGMSNAETAAYLHMNVEAIKKRHQRLKIRMRSRVVESEGDKLDEK